MAQYSLFMLKVLLNTIQPNKLLASFALTFWTWVWHGPDGRTTALSALHPLPVGQERNNEPQQGWHMRNTLPLLTLLHNAHAC